MLSFHFENIIFSGKLVNDLLCKARMAFKQGPSGRHGTIKSPPQFVFVGTEWRTRFCSPSSVNVTSLYG